MIDCSLLHQSLIGSSKQTFRLVSNRCGRNTWVLRKDFLMHLALKNFDKTPETSLEEVSLSIISSFLKLPLMLHSYHSIGTTDLCFHSLISADDLFLSAFHEYLLVPKNKREFK